MQRRRAQRYRIQPQERTPLRYRQNVAIYFRPQGSLVRRLWIRNVRVHGLGNPARIMQTIHPE